MPLALTGQGLDRLANLQCAAFDPARQDAADEGVGGKRRRQHAEGFSGIGDLTRRRNVTHDQVEKRVEVLTRPIKLRIGPARPARGVKVREVELVVIGAEVGEEVKNLVQRPVGFGIGLVDLVQYDDGAQAQRQRLGGHEFRLRHRPFGGIDQKDDTIDHVQDPLHLAAEIRVSGRVDDVDPCGPVFHARAFGQDGDAALTLDIVRIHRPFGRGLVFPERAGLLEKLVDKRRLAVVNVRDDRDIAKVHVSAVS